MDKLQIGSLGETIACHYLKATGYQVVATNLRNKIGEIDIIARQAGKTIFVEVKTRSSARYGLGREAINAQKQTKLIRVAQLYLQNKGLLNQPWQIDLIELTTDSAGEVTEIYHLENAVQG